VTSIKVAPATLRTCPDAARKKKKGKEKHDSKDRIYWLTATLQRLSHPGRVAVSSRAAIVVGEIQACAGAFGALEFSSGVNSHHIKLKEERCAAYLEKTKTT